MHRWARWAGALALVAGLLGVLAPGARAQDPGAERLVIRGIDATDAAAVSVTFAYSGDRADVASVAVRHDGELVDLAGSPVPLDSERPLGVVLLIDTSGSMNQGAAIERAREAALAFVDSKAPADRVAVVEFDSQVRVLQDFTTDDALLRTAVGNLAVGGGTALYDGVVRAAGLFRSAAFQPNVLLLTDGDDRDSTASLDQAIGALANSGAALFAVALDSGEVDTAAVQRLADESGGQVVSTIDPSDLEALFAGIQETLRRQYVVTFAPRAASGPSEVALTIGSHQDSAEFVSGALQEGAEAVRPAPIASPWGPEILHGSTGLALALALTALAVVMAAYSLGSSFLSREASLDTVLRPYDEGFVAADDERDEQPSQAFAQTQLLQRAVQITERFAERRGLLESIESKLERANLPLRPPEALFFYAAASLLLAALGFLLTRSIVGGAVVAAIAILVPPGVLNFLARRRRKAFEALLPDTLQLLSSTLRAGYSLMQGVEAVSQEVSEPMGRELRRVVTEARLGRPLEESLGAVADRMESGDFAWAVMAIGIQREVGGNLSELLMTVAETMTERERLRRDVNALTAEGRVSAMVLGLLPIGLAVFIGGANPGYLDPLFETTAGNVMLGASVIMALFGFVWMKKIIEIEI